MTTVLYVMALLAVLQGIAALIDGYRAASHVKSYRPRNLRTDRVVVFCPCKGLEPDFAKNVQSLMDQDYLNYEVRFVVESEKDPAYRVLKDLNAGVVVVAGTATESGQKVHNLTLAVGKVISSDEADIFVFCDSDARYAPHWLTSLVSPLQSVSAEGDDRRSSKRVNKPLVSTGYRWYMATRFHIPTLLRSAWNASVVSMLGDHSRNFAWGGSMAMTRFTFGHLKILDAWRGALSDDYAVTRAAQRAKVPIVFVPECLVPSHGECTFRELLEFTTRQIIITRVYHPALWRVGFLSAIIFSVSFYSMLFIEPLIAVTLFILAAWKSAIRLRSIQSVVSDLSLFRFSWFYILSTPLTALIYLYNMICSAVGTEIVWRDIRYKLISPNETYVFRDKDPEEISSLHSL